MASEKKVRFFGDGDSFGDGGGWVYLGDSPDQVLMHLKVWMENRMENRDPDDCCEIKTSLMTDSEVDALPEI